jgi:hypothetical protein
MCLFLIKGATPAAGVDFVYFVLLYNVTRTIGYSLLQKLQLIQLLRLQWTEFGDVSSRSYFYRHARIRNSVLIASFL